MLMRLIGCDSSAPSVFGSNRLMAGREPSSTMPGGFTRYGRKLNVLQPGERKRSGGDEHGSGKLIADVLCFFTGTNRLFFDP
jgi:hypothetical protein